MILKGRPAYKYRRGREIWNRFSSKYMTRSHRCWFITNIWKSDHRMNVTLGTDIKFTLSFLPAKSLCWWRRILSYFKTQKLWSEDNLNTIWIQMGRANLVTWTVLCFQFHTYRSLQHSNASRYFQTVAELCLSGHDFCPSKPGPFAQVDWRECACANFHSAKGTEALRQVHINPDLIFALHWLPVNVRIKYNYFSLWFRAIYHFDWPCLPLLIYTPSRQLRSSAGS